MGKAKKKRTREEEARLPPNRRHQACGRCSYEGEFKNVKRHNMLKHPGLALKLKNGAFGVGGAYEHLVRGNNNADTGSDFSAPLPVQVPGEVQGQGKTIQIHG